MASRTWVIKIVVTADTASAAADLDMPSTLAGGHGPEPLRRLADYLDRWTDQEIAATAWLERAEDIGA